MSSQVSNRFLPKLPCTSIQSVIEMMFVSCMCLFSLPLVPVPADVPSEHHQAKGGMCRERCLQNSTPLGSLITFMYHVINTNQLKATFCLNISPSPLLIQQTARFFKEDKGEPIHMWFLCCTETVSYSLDIKTVYSKEQYTNPIPKKVVTLYKL